MQRISRNKKHTFITGGVGAGVFLSILVYLWMGRGSREESEEARIKQLDLIHKPSEGSEGEGPSGIADSIFKQDVKYILESNTIRVNEKNTLEKAKELAGKASIFKQDVYIEGAQSDGTPSEVDRSTLVGILKGCKVVGKLVLSGMRYRNDVSETLKTFEEKEGPEGFEKLEKENSLAEVKKLVFHNVSHEFVMDLMGSFSFPGVRVIELTNTAVRSTAFLQIQLHPELQVVSIRHSPELAQVGIAALKRFAKLEDVYVTYATSAKLEIDMLAFAELVEKLKGVILDWGVFRRMVEACSKEGRKVAMKGVIFSFENLSYEEIASAKEFAKSYKEAIKIETEEFWITVKESSTVPYEEQKKSVEAWARSFELLPSAAVSKISEHRWKEYTVWTCKKKVQSSKWV